MFGRIFLFLLTNILIIAVLSVTVEILRVFFGIDLYAPSGGYAGLAVFCLIWGMGGSFVSLMISRWMAKKAMGVQLVSKSNGAEAQWLVDTVYKLAKQVGITTMPEVGIYSSPEINAFATGAGKNSALVAVSSGLLQNMNRDEIEGVLGHEISHISNGDMVTMTLLQGIMNAFVMFAARVIASAVTRDRNGGFVYFMIVMALQIVLGMLAMIVVAWFSRHREYRADLGGAQLTSKSKMIAGLQAIKKTLDIKTDEVAPSNMKAFMISARGLALWSTHPTLDDRIQALRSAQNLL